MHKTLIDPSTLARHLNDPAWVVIDCRFDLTDPEKGEQLYREAHIPGARSGSASVGAEDGQERPASAARHRTPLQDVRRAWHQQRLAGRGL
jgi:thiosulfate/3-mercaptopyruvate sulfurtransferase